MRVGAKDDMRDIECHLRPYEELELDSEIF